MVSPIVKLATMAGIKYRMTTAILKQETWKVNHKRVEQIWRKQGLKVLIIDDNLV